MSLREPNDPKPFVFRVRGHGHDIAAGTYLADHEDNAFKLALQKCRGFDLPGWELYCETTGTTVSVVEFIDPAQSDGNGRPARVRA